MVTAKSTGVLAIGILALFLGGCSSTSLTGSWRNPEYSGGKADKVLVVGVAQKDLIRRLFEDEFVRQLRNRGVEATPSYPLFSLEDLKDHKGQIEAEIRSRGIDKVLVTRLTGKRTEEITHPGYVSRAYPYPPSAFGGYGWHGHYVSSYNMVVHPPTTFTSEIATLESTLYDVGSGNPVWSAMLETEMGEIVESTIRSFVEVVIQDLEKGELI